MDKKHAQLLAFTQRHIAKQQEKAEFSDGGGFFCTHEFIWKQKIPYARCKPNQKIKYENLNKDLQALICEFAGLEGYLERAIEYYCPGYDERYDMRTYISLGVDVNEVHEKTPLSLMIGKYAWINNDFIKERIVQQIRFRHWPDIESALASCGSLRAFYYVEFKYLLAHGADYNKKNEAEVCEGEETPLHAAANNFNTMPLLQDLLQLPNINLHVKNKWELTALDEARRSANNTCIHPDNRKRYHKNCVLLEQAGASSNVVLEPMPSDEQMANEHRYALARMERESREWGFVHW